METDCFMRYGLYLQLGGLPVNLHFSARQMHFNDRISVPGDWNLHRHGCF